MPEVQRAELAGVVLQLKALGVDNLVAFPWLAPPPAEAAVRALELLHALHAIDSSARCLLMQLALCAALTSNALLQPDLLKDWS